MIRLITKSYFVIRWIISIDEAMSSSQNPFRIDQRASAELVVLAYSDSPNQSGLPRKCTFFCKNSSDNAARVFRGATPSRAYKMMLLAKLMLD